MLSILLSLLFALLVFFKKKTSVPDRLLGMWLLVWAVQSLFMLLNVDNMTRGLLRVVPILTALMHGPFLFLYVEKSSMQQQKMKILDCVHCLPFLSLGIASLFFAQETAFHATVTVLASISGMVYIVLTFVRLKKHRSNISDCFSYIEKIDLEWVHRMTTGLLLIWIGVFSLILLKQIAVLEIPKSWFFAVVPLFVFYTGYFGLKQQVIYPALASNRTMPLKDKARNKSRNKKPGLLPEDMKLVYNRLLQAMQTDELFTRPALSLQELSAELNIPQHQVTQALKHFARRSFYDFINSYRVSAFIQRLGEDQAISFHILGIAFDCGFSTKSSFNRVFKDTTGLSPSEYKKRVPFIS
jgi:AraC-like DNA-binding protein